MEEMTHKEYMGYLKKYDPILYSELTSDPTNTSSDDSGCLGVIFIGLIALGIWGLVRYLLDLI
jgi:hypothetical protein